VSRATLAPLLLLLTALVSGAAVFAIHELEKGGSAIDNPRVTRALSPNGDGRRDNADIRFRVPAGERVTVTVTDAEEKRVRRLAARRVFRGGAVRLRWDGQSDGGARVAEGRYLLRIELHELGREYTLPGRLVVDVTPPAIGTFRLDLTRVSTLGVVRGAATGVRDSVERDLMLDGRSLCPCRVARSPRQRAAHAYASFFMSARLPKGLDAARAGLVELVITDRAGNESRMPGTVVDGALRVPARAPVPAPTDEG